MFSKNIFPATVPSRFFAGSSVGSGPCFQAHSLRLKCWSDLFSLFSPCISVHCEYKRMAVCSGLFPTRVHKTHRSVLTFHVTFFPPHYLPVQQCDFSPCATTWENNGNNFPPVLYAAGRVPRRAPETTTRSAKISQRNIPGGNTECVPENAGYCSSRKRGR